MYQVEKLHQRRLTEHLTEQLSGYAADVKWIKAPTGNTQISIYILRSGFSVDVLIFAPTIQTHQRSLAPLSV